MAAFRHAAYAIEHVAFAGLAPWAVCLFLPFAYPAVCAAHANLLFVHPFHPFNWHNIVYINPHNTLHAGLYACTTGVAEYVFRARAHSTRSIGRISRTRLSQCDQT